MRVKLGKIADSDYDGCTACCNLTETATIAAAIAVTFQKKRKVTNSYYIEFHKIYTIKRKNNYNATVKNRGTFPRLFRNINIIKSYPTPSHTENAQ